jgi:predicted nucleic acid-binding protein
LKTDWKQLIEVPITTELINQAVELAERYKLRGADAIHLAAALNLQSGLRKQATQLRSSPPTQNSCKPRKSLACSRKIPFTPL